MTSAVKTELVVSNIWPANIDSHEINTSFSLFSCAEKLFEMRIFNLQLLNVLLRYEQTDMANRKPDAFLKKGDKVINGKEKSKKKNNIF